MKTILMTLGALLPFAASAQAFPHKPIKLVVPLAAGVGSDALARAMSYEIGRKHGHRVVVENRPGANGSIAATSVLSQPADGYTVYLAGVSNLAWNPYLYKNLSYNPMTDFKGVALVASADYITATSKKSGIHSLQELVAKAKAQPGALNYASAGVGNSTHLASELLMRRTGIQMQHIPFNGSGSFYTTVLSGETPVVTSLAGDLIPMVKDGKLTALAVSGEARKKEIPDVPTFKELGIEMDVLGWFALVVKKGTPQPVIDQLNQLFNEALKGEKSVDILKTQVMRTYDLPPSAVDEMMQKDYKAWGPIITELNIAQ